MNIPSKQNEESLARLATKEELKALEARIERIEARFAPLSDEARRESGLRCAATYPELMQMLERLERRKLQPGYAELIAELERMRREGLV